MQQTLEPQNMTTYEILQAELKRVSAERDALRAALREALDAMELHGQQYPHMQKGYTVDAIDTARNALRKAP